MSKQDRQGARTVPDLERKYNFGEKFSEILGIANDAQDAAAKATEAVDKLDDALTPEEIFNRLTDDGKWQGIYREDDNIYINASYIKAGKLDADLVEVINLVADNIKSGTLDASKVVVTNLTANTIKSGVLESADGKAFFDLDLGYFAIDDRDDSGDGQRITLNKSGVTWFFHKTGSPANILGILVTDHNASIIGQGGFPLQIYSLGGACLGTTAFPLVKIIDKTVSWKDNGDGTYTLIGTD